LPAIDENVDALLCSVTTQHAYELFKLEFR